MKRTDVGRHSDAKRRRGDNNDINLSTARRRQQQRRRQRDSEAPTVGDRGLSQLSTSPRRTPAVCPVTGQHADVAGDFTCLVFVLFAASARLRVIQSATCPVRQLAIRELVYPRVVQLPSVQPNDTVCSTPDRPAWKPIGKAATIGAMMFWVFRDTLEN